MALVDLLADLEQNEERDGEDDAGNGGGLFRQKVHDGQGEEHRRNQHQAER